MGRNLERERAKRAVMEIARTLGYEAKEFGADEVMRKRKMRFGYCPANDTENLGGFFFLLLPRENEIEVELRFYAEPGQNYNFYLRTVEVYAQVGQIAIIETITGLEAYWRAITVDGWRDGLLMQAWEFCVPDGNPIFDEQL